MPDPDVFIHTFTGMESGVLMLMALDRCVAICYPLRYSILTNPRHCKGGSVLPFSEGCCSSFLPFLTKRLPCRRQCNPPHLLWPHVSVAKLSCGNIKVNTIYGLIVALLIGGFDILCITVSYTMILRAVSASLQHKLGRRPSTPARLTSVL